MEIKPCPYCGDQPEVSTSGSCIDIECCASMSIQKCNHLTMEERATTGKEIIPGYFEYSDDVEAKVLGIAISFWNQRVPQS